jgi:two-component system, NarL family, response regulator LiaR
MSEAQAIRVLIVDDHYVVREGLSAVLYSRAELEFAGAADEGSEAIRLCGEVHPDVVLMDLLMPGMDGITATRAIREKYPHIQVVALTSFQDRKLVREVLQAGAVSYLLKNVSADDLVKSIQAAAKGLSILAPEAMQALVQAGSESATPAPGHDLTAREHEVLALMIAGLSNPDIAERLMVSQSTAKAHVSHILSKLGVSNRAEAIVLALQHHLGTDRKT